MQKLRRIWLWDKKWNIYPKWVAPANGTKDQDLRFDPYPYARFAVRSETSIPFASGSANSSDSSDGKACCSLGSSLNHLMFMMVVGHT